MSDQSKKQVSENLSVSEVKETVLQNQGMQNAILNRITNDAFNIVSNLSQSEVTIGAWVCDKKTVDKLHTIYSQIIEMANISSKSDYSYFTARYIDFLYDNKNALYGFLNLKRIFLEYRLSIKKNVEFLNEVAPFKLEVKHCLKIEEIDHKIVHLNCFGAPRTSSADFSSFSHLKYLNCASLEAETLFLPPTNTLEYLDCSINNLKNLDLTGSMALEKLFCSFNILNELDLSKHVNIKYIKAAHNKLENIDLPDLMDPENEFHARGNDHKDILLNVYDNDLQHIDVSYFNHKRIICDANVVVRHSDFTWYDNGEANYLGIDENFSDYRQVRAKALSSLLLRSGESYTSKAEQKSIDLVKEAIRAGDEVSLIHLASTQEILDYHLAHLEEEDNLRNFLIIDYIVKQQYSKGHTFIRENLYWELIHQCAQLETELDDLILAQTPETLSELFNGSGVCKSLRLCSNTNIEKLTITLNLKKIDCSYFNLKSLRFVHTFLEDSWKERRRLSKYDYCTEVIDCRGNNLDCLDLRGMDCLKEVHCDRGLEVLLNSDLDRSKIIHEY